MAMKRPVVLLKIALLGEIGVVDHLDLPPRDLGIELQVERGNLLLACGKYRMMVTTRCAN